MQPTKALPNRSEIAASAKWRLEDIYASDDAWERDFQALPALLQEIAAWQGRITEGAAALATVLELHDRINLALDRLFTYGRMRRDEDNANATYQAMTERVMALGTVVAGKTAFLVPEILTLSEVQLQAWLDQEPRLQVYRFFLQDTLRQKPHVLSREEEALLAQAGDLAQVPSHVFTMLNNADLRFPVIRDEQGHEVEITHGRFVRFMESRDRRVRRDAFAGFYQTYGSVQNTLAATLGAVIKRDIFYARARKHPSALEASLFADQVPLAVYDNLIATIRAGLPVLHRYVRLRKQLLGVDELHMYDLYVPLTKDMDWHVPYEEAVAMVQESLRPLGEEYGRVLAEGFQSGWVDVYENRGKTSGAYSWGPYGTHPFVLMNYQGTLDDVFTLAHEMGHAMHSYYAHQQPYVNSQYSIFAAEVASTVNETLLMHYLLKTVKDDRQRASLVNHYLEQFRGTVFRQTMFAEFEKAVHAHVEAGQAVTPPTLGAQYRQLNQDYYGPDMVVDEPIALEWSRIPHFYSNFYVYKYATGFSAATSLAQQILEQGEPAVARYLAFLRSGGSDYPLEQLQAAGVDMTSPEPIAQSLQVFATHVEELARLNRLTLT
ncbi:oligoendopeptidase F [Heliophilum fasciatum]|uniref:Oligopeptidase F n=1 Tax=Heliophilum fasciatum TaxID=35700 RepID=A0A4V2SY42_9FIRM|nr:oligoendopeptidase F [Heliophilum fasciatum]MCW2276914.1 oligoendopeptidase F [Heliophilum fasciatum]TCP68626.1 oligopeptidase F [Heliophilum fasciatum]